MLKLVSKTSIMRHSNRGQSRFKSILFLVVGIVVLWWLWRSWYRPTAEDYLNEFRPPNSKLSDMDISSEFDVDKKQKPKPCDPNSGLCLPDGITLPAKGLFAHGNQFYLDGKPFRILSGSFHYFRVHQTSWGDRLMKMKAAGLNTVDTYIPWNLHEPVKRSYMFGGDWDLNSFIRMVHQVGLKMIVRPGPYICAEWEYGGLPHWLLRDVNMKIRSSYHPYINLVKDYFNQLLPILAQWQHKSGKGPIIAFQIENEFGSYGNHNTDPGYMNFLLSIFQGWNLNELLFTSDGTKHLLNGTIPGVLSAINFVKDVTHQLPIIKKFQPDKPILVAEYWAGWFDHWMEEHHAYNTSLLEHSTTSILKAGGSVNFYMFVGGTNWGFWNGGNNEPYYQPTTTSYDYDAPISESGQLMPKFFAVKKIIKELKLGPMDWPIVPKNPESVGYGAIDITKSLTYDVLVDLISEKPTLMDVTTMEMLDIKYKSGQFSGWLLYRTKFPSGKILTIKGRVRDRAQIILNSKVIKVLNFTHIDVKVNLLDLKAENQLDIFVENLGRANYKSHLNEERKGILGSVYVDEQKLQTWQHVPFEFLKSFRTDLGGMRKWKSFFSHSIPAAYKGILTISDKPKDTFILMDNWTKGIVLVNGWNLGRYWNVGPQQTLYIPAGLLLKGNNHIIIFELHKGQPKVKFVKRHVWQTKKVS